MSSIIMPLLFCFMGIVVGDLRVKELPRLSMLVLRSVLENLHGKSHLSRNHAGE